MYKKIDAITKRWIRNKSDDYAVTQGCRFDTKRGEFVCQWIEKYCKLYKNVPPDTQYVMLDWHRDVIMRLFSWVKYSEFWKSEIRRFNRGGIWTPKKNAKSVLLAFMELYMLVGDGVHGQNCYVAAKDGTQSRETQKNLLEAIRASSLLSGLFEINKTKGIAVHTESRSSAVPIAGDNDEATEGLDGSCFIDEAHVCTTKLMSRLQYMGRARKEPLILCVSTAGNNPDGWGKTQWDYGRLVEKGEIKDIGYFHVDWALPDEVKEADIEKNIDKYGKMCNPAWNVLINPETFRQDFMASKRSKSALADFMMYSFNRWQKASNPWLNKEAWEDCAVTQEEVNHALNARECSCALDLGQVNDPSAFAMCSFIPDEVQPSEEGEPVGKYYFDIVIFMTEKYAEDHAATEGFLEWAKAGHLILMPGDTQDYGFIRKTVRQYAATRRIFEIAYDPMFAEDVTQQLQQGTEYEDGIGCQRVAFPQTGPVWAKPTKDFENALMARQLRHPNNPVLNWMSGHCEAKEDAYSNKRPIKPDNQAKKIDGIIAMVMSHARATLRRPQPSISLM